MTEIKGARIHITGIVQVVGFRPFVYGLATRWALTGRVCYTSSGVDIEVDGTQAALDAFLLALEQEAPTLSKIDSLQAEVRVANGFEPSRSFPPKPNPEPFSLSPPM